MSSFLTDWWKRFQSRICDLLGLSSSEKKIHLILCVDDDIDFCRYLQRLGHLLGVRLDRALSIAEAKKKIEGNNDYQAYIVDGHLPDGSGFDLARLIREKKGTKVPIGFVSRFYQDAASFRLLREILHVDYVLEKPIRPEDVENFLVLLCGIQKPEENKKEEFPNEILSDLVDEYQKSIGEKIENIEKLLLEVEKNPSLENLSALKTEVHKIAGSAGSYGYKKAGDLCKALDNKLKELIDHFPDQGVPADWINSLDEFYGKLKIHFQMDRQF